MNAISFIAVPLQCGRGQFMLTPFPFSWSLYVFQGLSRSTNCQPEKTSRSSNGIISTLAKSTLQRLQSFLPVWKRNEKHQDQHITQMTMSTEGNQSSQVSHMFLYRLSSQLHQTLVAFALPAESLAMITGQQKGQKPFWLSEPGRFGRTALLGDDCLVTMPV